MGKRMISEKWTSGANREVSKKINDEATEYRAVHPQLCFPETVKMHGAIPMKVRAIR